MPVHRQGVRTMERAAAARDHRAMTTGAAHRLKSGWVTFAAIVALIAGAYNALSGLSTLVSDYAAVEDVAEVLFGISVDAWAWFWLIAGALQLATGFLLIRRNLWGQYFGVMIAGLSAMIALFSVFAWPLWAFSVLVLNILVIYALLTHGDEFD
jgi:hypothetical protein